MYKIIQYQRDKKKKPYKQHLSKFEDSPISAYKSLFLEPDPCEVFL
jgi:hypothetical protein